MVNDNINDGESLWCSTCVAYFQLKNAKKIVDFEIPVNEHDVEPAITSIDYTLEDYDRVKINHEPQPRGVLARMQKKGLKITSYSETDSVGRSITLKRYHDDE